ncbi:MAG: glycosyltransferase [bacterium]
MSIRWNDLLPPGHSEEAREELARGGLKTAFSLNTPDGWKTVDSPWEPRGEARRAFDRVAPDASSILVIGCGSGFFAEELIARGVNAALLVTGSRILAQRTLERIEQAGGAPENIEIRIVSGNDPERVWGEEIEGWLASNPNAVTVEHPREKVVFPALFGSLAVRVALRSYRPDVKKSSPSKRILLLGSGGLMEKEMRRALEQGGVDVQLADPVARKPLTVEKGLSLIDRHSPDIILSTNLLGADPGGILPELCQQLGIGWGTWLLDDPRFLIGPAEAMGAGRDRVAFCWDRNGMDGWYELGFTRAEPLPLATDPDLFQPGDGDPDLKGRVVFVGSPRFASAEGFFARLDEDLKAIPVAEELIEEVMRSRRPPAPQRVREVVASLGLEGHFELEAERRLAAWVVQRANQQWRESALRALAPLHPIVYGAGWEGRLPDEIELRGLADYDRDLPRIYASDAVHISLTNLQMRAWPNQRLFDIPAAGGCVLTDRLEELDDLFGDAISSLTFETPQQLADLAASLVVNADARHEHATELRRVVLERHTVRHRVQRMLEVLDD